MHVFLSKSHRSLSYLCMCSYVYINGKNCARAISCNNKTLNLIQTAQVVSKFWIFPSKVNKTRSNLFRFAQQQQQNLHHIVTRYKIESGKFVNICLVSYLFVAAFCLFRQQYSIAHIHLLKQRMRMRAM